MDRTPRILMCPPDYYGIEYEINPWMNRKWRATRPSRAGSGGRCTTRSWRWGCEIERLDPVPGLPDLVFTANAGLVYHDRFISSRFRYGVRQGETPHFDRWAREHGFSVVIAASAASTSKGPAMPSSAARRCSPAIGSGAMPGATSGSASCSASRSCRSSWSTRGSTISIPASVPSIRNTAIYYPGAFDDYGRRSCRTGSPPDRGLGRGGRHLQLQRRGRRPDGDPQRGDAQARASAARRTAMRSVRSG